MLDTNTAQPTDTAVNLQDMTSNSFKRMLNILMRKRFLLTSNNSRSPVTTCNGSYFP